MEISEKRLTDWTLEFDKLGGGFSMAGIPQRIFLHIAKCAGLHTQPFEKIMELPQEDNGYVGDYIHPRFVAVLLQLGDILDMDNDRFHPLTKECMGVLPENISLFASYIYGRILYRLRQIVSRRMR